MDELVKRLRKCAELHGECALCLYQGKGCDAMPETPLVQAADAIEKLGKPRWISTEELLPKDLQNVLVIDDGRVTIGHCEHYYGDEQIYVEWHDTLYYPIDPPYWMPLPQPPEEG